MNAINKGKQRIGIIGHFGGNEVFMDGQTVKVKSLYEGFVYNFPDVKIDKVDTYYLNKNPIKLFFSFLNCLFHDKQIVFLPAARGRKYMFVIFYYIGKILNKEFYHDCIAGSLDKTIASHPMWFKYLNSFKINWMESPDQVEKLQQLGIKNATYLPNFKHIEPVSLEEMRAIHYSKPFELCTFSRVEPKKGIEDALKAITDINLENGFVARLDVYGPVQPGFEEWFEQIKCTYKDIMNYKGVVDSHASVATIKNYFALLFPTQYYTEGMPGTIIDAMFAGVPVIARRWAWCDNMIKNGYNGVSYDFNKPELLKDILFIIANNPDTIISMKGNCIKESIKYSEKETMNKICQTMGLV